MRTFHLLLANFLRQESNAHKNQRRRQEQGPIHAEHQVRAKAQREQVSSKCLSCETERMPVLRKHTKCASKQTCTQRCGIGRQKSTGSTVHEIGEHLQGQKVNSDDTFSSWGSFCGNSHPLRTIKACDFMQKFMGVKYKINSKLLMDNNLRLEAKIVQMRNQNQKAKWNDSQVYLKNGGVILHSFMNKIEACCLSSLFRLYGHWREVDNPTQ